MLEKIAIIWLIFINVHGFVLMRRDKRFARSEQGFRIPTATFVLVSVLGGSVGVLLAMLILRHKLDQKVFQIVIPIILVLEVALGVYLKLR